MRILWFTNTPSGAGEEFGYKSFGGGWISSLEILISGIEKYELGICFFYPGTYKKKCKGNIVYYGVPLKTGNAIKRVISRHLAHLDDEDPFYIFEVIDDFKPDLIHVFGTEMGYGQILMHRSEKVVFNLQGLLSPIVDAYYPPGFTKLQVLLKSKLSHILRGISLTHEYRMLKHRAQREGVILKHWKYFSGRTEWDRNHIRLINPVAHYFHCEELLRKEFFENEWIQPHGEDSNREIVIGTTFNSNLYKGLDLVYKVLCLIKKSNIRWKIFGISKDDAVNRIICKILKPDNKSDQIEFHGQLCSDELINQLKTCHFFVHPSYIDNSPNSVCEAMILGMPVLASSVGGIPTLIEDGETGFLFNPYDKYHLAGLLADLINNYEEAKQAGLNARKVALKRHSPDNIISVLGDIYNTICAIDQLTNNKL